MAKTDWANIRTVLSRSNKKYRFYFGTYSYEDFAKGKVARGIPKSTVGWARRAVDIRSNKTNFDKFENDTLGLNEIFAKYRVLDAFDKLKDDILVCGCGFLALAGDRVMPFTAEEATGKYNWYDQNLKEGVVIFNENTDQAFERLRIPDSSIEYDGSKTTVINNGVETVTLNTIGRPLMAVLTHKSTAKRPFGRSIISKPARDAIIDASRTVRQSMIAAHFYNEKVDVLLGVDAETAVDKVEGRSGDILRIGANENGQIPQIGEMAQHAMAPFNDTIMIAARNFCSDTKLSLANLGISTNAPQSTEALEIVNDDLKDAIVDWQKELGDQLKYFAITLWMHDNDVRQLDENLMAKIDAIVPVWKSVFREDVSKFGDGLNKIAQDAPAIVKARSVWRNLGLTSDEIDKVIESA